MAFQKNFVIRNGLEVNNNLIFADRTANSVGIGTTIVTEKLQVEGTIGSVDMVLSGIGTIPTLNSTNATISDLSVSNTTIAYLVGTAATIPIFNTSSLTGTAATISTLNSTNGTIDTLGGNTATFGNGNFTYSNITYGTITNAGGTYLNYSGISTVGSLSIGSTEVISSTRELKNISSLDATTTATIESAIANAPNTFTDLEVTGISTLGITEVGSINVSGVSTFAGITTVTGSTLFAKQLNISGVSTLGSGVTITGTTFTNQLNVSGITTSSSFVKSGGTSSQFLKADGSVDSNTYLTSYTETDTLDSVTTRGNSTTNGVSVGVLTATSVVRSGGTSSQFLKADGSVDSNTYLTSYTETDTLDSVTTRGSTTSNNITVGIVTATSFVKSGGTSSQFLKADGSVDSNTYLTSYAAEWARTDVGIHTLSNVGVGTTNPTSTLTVKGNTSLESLTVSGVSTFLSLTNLNQVTETVVNNFNTTLSPTGIGSTLTIDTSLGSVILGDLDAPVATWDFTNVPTANSKATTITLIINGDISQTYGSGCNVNGSAVSGGVKWPGNLEPVATANYDVLTFTIIKDGAGTINVFGSSTTNIS